MIDGSIVEAGQYDVQIDAVDYNGGSKGWFGGVEVKVGYSKKRHDSRNLLQTVEVHRHTERRQTYDEQGRRRVSRVTVVTYRDRYSNGRVRTYVRTYP